MIYKNKLPEIKNILKLFFKFIANISKNNGINTEKSIYNLVNIKNLKESSNATPDKNVNKVYILAHNISVFIFLKFKKQYNDSIIYIIPRKKVDPIDAE